MPLIDERETRNAKRGTISRDNACKNREFDPVRRNLGWIES